MATHHPRPLWSPRHYSTLGASCHPKNSTNVVSVGTIFFNQRNVTADRQIQDRNRLSALIEQLPIAQAQSQATPAFTDLVSLVAGSAATLMDKLGPGASTANEKSEVAQALVVGSGDLASAKRLLTEADQQSTTLVGKVIADHFIAEIDFDVGDEADGRAVYRPLVSLLRTPQKELDSPLLRGIETVNIELFWINDELTLAKNCQSATDQLKNAEQTLAQLPPDRVGPQTTNVNNAAKFLTTHCPLRSGDLEAARRALDWPQTGPQFQARLGMWLSTRLKNCSDRRQRPACIGVWWVSLIFW
jgi:hypothetical protein